MRRKIVEKLTPTKPKRKGLVATVQNEQDILILNIYKDKVLKGRYCMDTRTNEYQSWYTKDDGIWTNQKLSALCGWEPIYYGIYHCAKELKFNSSDEENLIWSVLEPEVKEKANTVYLLDRLEDKYNRGKRERAEDRRRERVQAVMDQVPNLPEGIRDWIWEKATGRADYVFYYKESDTWQCTHCGKSYKENNIHRVDGGKKIRHNDMVKCPRCNKVIQAKKRTKKYEQIEHLMILQPVNFKYSVARHFDVKIHWAAGKRDILINESMRLTLNKMQQHPKYACDIYYNQYSIGGAWGTGWDYEVAYFDNKGNSANRRTYAGYLYESGIEESLEDTAYESWTRLFCQMAAGGQKLQYNRLMCTQKDEHLQNVVECLYKGRFYQLLYESTEDISYWCCEYCGPLVRTGNNIEEVFKIEDRQKINRIRDMDGGKLMLKWMRYSDEEKVKIPQDTLIWLIKENLDKKDMSFVLDRMSLSKIMNYVKRQQAESYKGKSARVVLDQWDDYLCMCERLKKNQNDEMVFRPRELKRRHDEAVAEIQLREAQLQADEYSERYPGTEDVLREIKEKFEWQNAEYIIIVPERLVDIVYEGRALHHCVGSCDRYFDRIKSHETYVCFLRKAAEPEKPYYTIEVEPGGTIRQHRGYLDEEPEIETVKPVLREWQQSIRKRMTQKDHEYAAVSAEKRAQNIEELKAKNNTRVLEGLMEDFMEAV